MWLQQNETDADLSTLQKIDTLWVKGHRKATKTAHFGGLGGTAIDAMLQNAISLSIFGVRSSSLGQIEAQIEEISQKNMFSKSGHFDGTLLMPKSTAKSRDSCLGL